MAWTGKIIGGVLGSFIGPWGAAIGMGIGHQFDAGASKVQEASMMMQVAFFGCMAKLAQADGTVSREEIAAVEQIMTKMGYTPVMREAAIKIFREAKDDAHTAQEYVAQLAATIRFNQQLGMTFLGALHAIAHADGIVCVHECEILLQAETAFRLPSGTVEALLGGGRRGNDVGAAYKVLECRPEQSDAEIKKVYREKCIAFHPDKLASKGLPDEFMKYANEQLTSINMAYDTIQKSRAGYRGNG